FLCLLLRLATTGCPLFPYTTLFRSRRDDGPQEMAQLRAERDGLAHAYGHRAAERQGVTEHAPDRWAHEQLERDHRAHRVPRQPEDRKSTRLNSSHDQISYAVFCLKK